MQFDVVVKKTMQGFHRPEAGHMILVQRVTLEDGTSGLVVFENEWDKRDCLGEALYCEPQIAEALEKAMPGLADDGESPSSYNYFIGDGPDVGTQDQINGAERLCDTRLYLYE